MCYSFIAYKHWVNFQKLFYPINKKLNAQCELKMSRIYFRFFSGFFSGLLPILVLDLGHGDSLEALGCHRVRLGEVVELLLAQVVNKSGADWVAQHVDGSSESKWKEIKNTRLHFKFFLFSFLETNAARELKDEFDWTHAFKSLKVHKASFFIKKLLEHFLM